MLKIISLKTGQCIFCGGNKELKAVANDDDSLRFPVCAECQKELITVLSANTAEPQDEKQVYSDKAQLIMKEAASMSEDKFEEKYLTDVVDRVVFEYIRGYGKTELDGSAMGLLSIMTEQSADVISVHLQKLVEEGLVYPVSGQPDWFGADYPFADD